MGHSSIGSRVGIASLPWNDASGILEQQHFTGPRAMYRVRLEQSQSLDDVVRRWRKAGETLQHQWDWCPSFMRYDLNHFHPPEEKAQAFWEGCQKSGYVTGGRLTHMVVPWNNLYIDEKAIRTPLRTEVAWWRDESDGRVTRYVAPAAITGGPSINTDDIALYAVALDEPIRPEALDEEVLRLVRDSAFPGNGPAGYRTLIVPDFFCKPARAEGPAYAEFQVTVDDTGNYEQHEEEWT
jgi:hypothetical protein